MKSGLRWSPIAVIALVLPACSSGSGSGAGGTAAAASLSYYRDAKPVIDAKCGHCHVNDGIAPFPLTTYEDVKPQLAAMKGAILGGLMPPWPPADDCNHYLGDRSLTADEKSTLTGWMDAGAPEGDPKDKPNAVTDDATKLSRVDLELSMPVAYTPKLSPDEYRCFLVDWPEAETTFVTGFGVEPGAAAIVHHVIAYIATPDTLASFQALDDADPGPGYKCFGGPGGDKQAPWIGGWAPGTLGSDFPEGTGIEVPAGSKIVMQLHYNTATTAPVPDQSKILLKTDKTVAKPAVVVPFADPKWIQQHTMDIPAHTMDATHEFAADVGPYLGILTNGTIQGDKPYTVHSAGLHMHTRGTHATTSIQRKDSSNECLLSIPQWNFHWQGSYGLRTPTTVSPGDKLSVECHWNNMDATDVNWGEDTSDEMCLATFYITQ